MSDADSTYSAATLVDIGTKVICGMGAPLELANAVSKSLVLSNLVGHDSHGIIRLMEYSGWVESGNLIPNAYPKVAWSKEATSLIDGSWGWGQSASYLAIETVISLAQKYGTATVVLSKTNHVGRLGEYVDLISRAGMMGIAFCNTGGPIVAPFGGTKRVLGTNPYAWSIPGSDNYNFVLDFSTAVVAAGKIILAGMSGESIEPGSLIDKNGQPTTNAADLADGGSLLAFGGHKGSGLSVLIDLAAGILSGNMPAAISDSGYGNGTIFMAVDISRYAAPELFKSVASQFETIMHDAGEPGRVLLPGEFEHETLLARKVTGISISAGVREQVIEIAKKYGVLLPELQ
ncbi:MAG: Ldh family oxidoreductase [Acidobacteria bacterium]|nr:Ldh family oxidoreductase [Acidobacteriota bacterium]